MTVDFIKLALEAIRDIDALRSTDANTKNADNNSTRPVESRINALYRAIGLPGFVSSDSDVLDPNKNNGNLFTIGSLSETEINTLVNERKSEDVKFLARLTAEQLDASLDNIRNKITDSIGDERTKGSLFPMIVNGDLRIYPQDRRVGGAFYPNDIGLTNNKIVYRRPLIELIVLMRLKQEGLANSQDQDELQNAFPELKDAGFFNPSGENILALKTLRGLLDIIFNPEGVRKVLDNTIRDLGRIRTQIRETYDDTPEVSVPAGRQPVRPSDGRGSFEQQELERNLVKSESEAQLTLLDFDDANGQATRNMREAALASIVIDAMLSDSSEIDRLLFEEDVRERKLKQRQRDLNRNLDLILGHYSGISGIDILAVISALFAIEQKDLLGLLNPSNQRRLLSIKGIVIAENADPASAISSNFGGLNTNVADAIDKLENKVKQLFEELENRVNIKKLTEKGYSEE